MEQAINSFSQGLQLDTHPMVQGNNTMTDCLNGTLITMNGNETILQNDMGNRRVDNAFLPAGYEPVGIKEYGGIIYIAAYNPITNRSQVGSFPSPERRIGIYDDDLGGNISPEQFTAHPIEDLNKLFCLDSDTIQIPLTDKTSLHAGDKFVVYHQGYDEWFNKENLSNYDNIFQGENNEEKIYSPKNKKYSAQIGILNSQNTFVDITKSLCRWNTENGQYIDTSNKPDLYKFNVGYFIKNQSSNEMSAIAIKDKQFQNERELNKASVNTYAYKLVGPMYMQLKVNHIQSFDYNIWGSFDKNNNNTLTLTVEGIATYNCPDSLIEGINGGNDTYKTFELLENFIDNANVDNYIMFDLFRCVDDDDRNIHENVLITQLTDNDQQNEFYSLKKGVFTYDEVSNLYTARITKEYVIKNFEEDIFNYVIGVRTPININGNPTYLSGLSTKGQININLLGSGDTNARRWQFYYENSEITLKYNFDFYPKPDEKITNLIATLKNVENQEDTRKIILFENISTGSQGKRIKINGLTPKALYKAELSYTVNGNTDFRYEHDEFILTTSLFNDCFDRGNSQILDYGWPGGVQCNTINSSTNIDDEGISKEIKTFKEKLRIQPYISVGVDSEGMEIKEDQEGSFIKKGTAGDLITVEFSKSVNPKLTINDSYFRIKDLYPSFIIANNSIRMKISSCITNLNLIKNDIKDKYEDYNDSNINTYFEETSPIIGTEGQSIEIKLKWKDTYKTQSQQFSGTIYNVFDSVNNYLEDHFNYNKKNDYNYKIFDSTAIQLIGSMRSGPDDYHGILISRLIKDVNNYPVRSFYNTKMTIHNAAYVDNGFFNNYAIEYKILYQQFADEQLTFTLKNKDYDYQAVLNDIFDKNSIFLYVFEDSDSDHYVRGYVDSSDNIIWRNDYNKIRTIEGTKVTTRVWWRDENDRFVLIDELLETQLNNNAESFKTDMINYFGKLFKTSQQSDINKIMFCRYPQKDFNSSDGFIYPSTTPGVYNNKPYKCNIPYTIYLTLSPINPSTTNLITVSKIQEILNFYLEENNLFSSHEIVKISSSNKYNDLINNNFSSIFRLENIDMDGNNYSLSNRIYNKENGQEINCNYVHKIINNNYREYQLVCKPNVKELEPTYKFDYFDDDDNHHTRTLLYYGQVPLFKPYNE